VPQAAVAVADPKAAEISEAEGLQPRVGIAPVIIIAGGLGALVQVTVLTAVAVLPQASIAVNVLVCEAEQEVVDIVPSLNVIVGVPQPSVAVAVPRPAVISEAKGLQPRVVGPPDVVIVGGTTSEVHVTVLTAVAVLPQASTAVNVLVCVCVHVPVTGPSVNEILVTAPQASVAVAVPRAASIRPAAGLHASVSVVPVAVITGGVRSEVQVTVLEVVALLPQASIAVNVLVCERLHPLEPTIPSEEFIVGIPHASVADAVPRAALISAAVGLHPGIGICVIVIVGGVTSTVHDFV
jgi:hypothetical protein